MNSEKIAISTEFIKLDSFLKFCGACISGGEAKEAVAAGSVLVGSQVCTERGKKLRPGDTVSYKGKNYEVMSECM